MHVCCKDKLSKVLLQQIASNKNLKNAPVTSVDLEKDFFAYTIILTDRRYQSLLLANLENHLIINCYSLKINNKDGNEKSAFQAQINN